VGLLLERGWTTTTTETMSTPEPQAISVSDLTKQIKNVLEGSFPILWISGEISNFVHHGSGHMYFTLKDEKAEIRGVMFKGFNQFLHFKPENGMQVLLQGDLTLYEARGQYQIVAKKMEPAGIGTLYLAFEALKKQLAAEGLFDQEIKQKLPVYPRCIGVITSQTGAAVRDIFQVLDRRAPHVDVILKPSRVQGDKAAFDLTEAINDMAAFNAVDVIIIGRGGGSLEDLWPFNEESVARAIFACPIPIISAVGHETDLSISDLVADMRAPTPSAAAEVVSPAASDLIEYIHGYERNLVSAMQRDLQKRWQGLDSAKDRFVLQQPGQLLKQHRTHSRELVHLMVQAYRLGIQGFSGKFAGANEKLLALNPMNILSRGYSIAYRETDQKIICDPQDLKEGDPFELQTFKGTFRAKRANKKK
jgi:exodeoxyribonuclease VII large subunit